MNWKENIGLGDKIRGVEDLVSDLCRIVGNPDDQLTTFDSFSRLLETKFEIKKGFLALRAGNQTRFLAVASWKKDKVRKKLSLTLPNSSSLFEKVAESGQIFAENFASLFDGNFIERQLLMDDSTQSFMLRPLKHEGRVVGLIGYSSDFPDAFVTIQEGYLDDAFDSLGDFLGLFHYDPVGP